MTPPVASAAWGLPSLWRYHPFPDDAKLAATRLNLSMPSRSFRQSSRQSRRAAAARQDRPARTIAEEGVAEATRGLRPGRRHPLQFLLAAITQNLRRMARLTPPPAAMPA